MSKTIAVRVRFESWYISLPSSLKQQREITKLHVFWRTEPRWQVFRPRVNINKYNYIFYKASFPPSPLSLLKFPYKSLVTAFWKWQRKWEILRSSVAGFTCFKSLSLSSAGVPLFSFSISSIKLCFFSPSSFNFSYRVTENTVEKQSLNFELM